MSLSKPDVLYPQFYRRFSCIGPKCENDCCHGWRVTIDKKTFEAYQQSDDIHLVDISNQMARPPKPTDKSYREITLNHQRHCPLQEDGGNCYVHSRYGQEMLSFTCRTYPRTIRYINGRPQPSLGLSCPEASRRILLDPFAMVMSSGPGIPDNLTTITVPEPAPYFEELQQVAMQVVSGGKGSADERLFSLGLLLQLLANRLEQGDNIKPICDQFLQMQANGELHQLYGKVKPGLDGLALVMEKMLQESRFFHSNVALFNFHQKFLNSITNQGLEQGQNGKLNIRELLSIRQPAFQQFVEESDQGLVNMILHWIYSDNLCTRKGKPLLRNYTLYVVKYILIRFYLMMLAEKGHGNELLVNIVYAFSRSSEHDLLFILKLYTKLSEEGWGSYANIMSLLKVR
jgi:lysine-N-methylase